MPSRYFCKFEGCGKRVGPGGHHPPNVEYACDTCQRAFDAGKAEGFKEKRRAQRQRAKGAKT